mmetsp:Transcript_12489/g.44914  ORF Transcript_12489/g.44914 Transcript_12489/m.44914 type:complete len:309 (-) Transcript_12489:550-1476(-)
MTTTGLDASTPSSLNVDAMPSTHGVTTRSLTPPDSVAAGADTDPAIASRSWSLLGRTSTATAHASASRSSRKHSIASRHVHGGGAPPRRSSAPSSAPSDECATDAWTLSATSSSSEGHVTPTATLRAARVSSDNASCASLSARSAAAASAPSAASRRARSSASATRCLRRASSASAATASPSARRRSSARRLATSAADDPSSSQFARYSRDSRTSRTFCCSRSIALPARTSASSETSPLPTTTLLLLILSPDDNKRVPRDSTPTRSTNARTSSSTHRLRAAPKKSNGCASNASTNRRASSIPPYPPGR